MIDKKIYYNTQREPLHLPEYGRHIQGMVEYIKTIQSKDERTRLSHVVIQVMANMTPQIKDNPEHKAKLWNQLAQIANYELDIDYPVTIHKQEDFKKYRKKISYPQKNTQLKHYGNISEQMAKAISQLPDGEEKNQLIISLANHMKKQYLLFNKEAVSDEQILSDLRKMADDENLTLPEVKLNETRDILYRNKPKQNKNNNHKNNKRRNL
ncbi:MAG: DUF4290 domain-containing protein [Bacteroidales bacterium]|nr:DUF4290 domain-containing protein [Bacteroidales bacterium]